jgi:hypothetical protein
MSVNMLFQGQRNEVWAQEAVKWGADFLVAAVDENQLLLHIGDVMADHAYFGRPEYYPPQIDRNIQLCRSGVSSFTLLSLANFIAGRSSHIRTNHSCASHLHTCQ